MAGDKNKSLSEFQNRGIYKFPNSKALFIHPIQILNRNYTQFRVSPSLYYSRFFNQPHIQSEDISRVLPNPNKRKRNQKNNKQNKCCYLLNEKELIADQRHQEIRDLLVKAHEELVKDMDLLKVICELNCESDGWKPCLDSDSGEVNEEVSFIELGKVWQAPLYEIALDFSRVNASGGSPDIQEDDEFLLPLFNNLVSNETKDDVVAKCLTCQYILPKESSFFMSDLGQIHTFLPDNSDCGFDLILIDPPWENRSAYQKAMYPTLPNRYFLSIPIRKLTHTRGALVALWVTNREKLRNFVENELFPAWGVQHVATWYWLKVKADGSLICDLDLFHHRPYECLLLGYSGKEVNDSELPSMENSLKDKQVIISIPGDYSRKPPIGELLLECVSGSTPARCIELFAREMSAGWTSWGNEPLHFQELRYFSRK